jgi:hypothetical protein
VQGAFVTANFFPLMGVSPILGRVFNPEEELRRDRVIVLSHELWMNRFGGSPLFRFGLDTLATGFWIACVAPAESFRGQGQVHIPSNLSRTIETLPPQARDMLSR